MFFKPFDDDACCQICGKNLNEVVNGLEGCQPCEERGLKEALEAPVSEHLLLAAELLFSFRFGAFIGALIVATQVSYHKVKSWIQKQFS